MASTFPLLFCLFALFATSYALLDVKLMSLNVMAADQPQNGCYSVVVTGVILSQADNRTEPIPSFGGVWLQLQNSGPKFSVPCQVYGWPPTTKCDVSHRTCVQSPAPIVGQRAFGAGWMLDMQHRLWLSDSTNVYIDKIPM